MPSNRIEWNGAEWSGVESNCWPKGGTVNTEIPGREIPELKLELGMGASSSSSNAFVIGR